ncbi:MAG: hypothetical protein RLZZ165_1057 [Bacteroidota bacterium]|jgi:hypothetical protein
MNNISTWLDHLDKELFLFLRHLFQSRLMEENAGILGDVHAWVPMFVFLAIVLYLCRPGAAVYSLFFGLAAFILSFQASVLLAGFLHQPSPAQYAYVMNFPGLPDGGRADGLGLPDWGIASLAAVFHFARLRVWQLDEMNISAGWLGVIVFCLIRIYAGYTYPLGALMAVLVGILVAGLMYKLARSVEMLSPAVGPPDSDE